MLTIFLLLLPWAIDAAGLRCCRYDHNSATRSYLNVVMLDTQRPGWGGVGSRMGDVRGTDRQWVYTASGTTNCMDIWSYNVCQNRIYNKKNETDSFQEQQEFLGTPLGPNAYPMNSKPKRTFPKEEVYAVRSNGSHFEDVHYLDAQEVFGLKEPLTMKQELVNQADKKSSMPCCFYGQSSDWYMNIHRVGFNPSWSTSCPSTDLGRSLFPSGCCLNMIYRDFGSLYECAFWGPYGL